MNSFEIELGGIASSIEYKSEHKYLSVWTDSEMEINPDEIFSKMADSDLEVQSADFICTLASSLKSFQPKILKNTTKLCVQGFSKDDPFDITPWLLAALNLEHLNLGRNILLDFDKISSSSIIKTLSLKISDHQKNISKISKLKKIDVISFQFHNDSPLIKLDKPILADELMLYFDKGSTIQEHILPYFSGVTLLWLSGFKKIPDLSGFNNLRKLIIAGSPKLKKMNAPNKHTTIYTEADGSWNDKK